MPVAEHMRDGRLEPQRARLEIAAVVARPAGLERQFFERRVADGDHIARFEGLLDLRSFEFGTHPVTAVVEASVLPTERAAHLAVGRVSDTGRIAVAAVRFGEHGHRDQQGRTVGFTRDDLYCRKILAVIERELAAQQFGGIVGSGLAEAQVTTQQVFVERALRDGGGTERVPRSGLHREVDACRAALEVHQHLVGRQARLGVAEGGCQTPQFTFYPIVGRMAEALTATQWQLIEQRPERGMLEPCAADLDPDLFEAHRFARLDGDTRSPFARCRADHFGAHLRGVVAERSQC